MKVLIVDEFALVREGLMRILADELGVVSFGAAGDDGYLSKRDAWEELVAAVRAVRCGEKYFRKRVARFLAEAHRKGGTGPLHDRLSGREPSRERDSPSSDRNRRGIDTAILVAAAARGPGSSSMIRRVGPRPGVARRPGGSRGAAASNRDRPRCGVRAARARHRGGRLAGRAAP